MTTEEAYKLADVRGFYDTPTWQNNEAEPWYVDFFEWKQDDLNHKQWGNLKYELFDTTQLKAAYVKGFVDKPGTSGENCIRFANSLKQVDKCAEFITHVCYENGIHNAVRKVTREYNYPICSTLEISDAAMEFFLKLKI